MDPTHEFNGLDLKKKNLFFCMGTSNQDEFGFYQLFLSAFSTLLARPPVGRQTPGTRVPDFHAISEPVTYIRAASSVCQPELMGETRLAWVVETLTHEGFLPGSSTLVGRAC